MSKHILPRGKASHKWKGGEIISGGYILVYSPDHSRHNKYTNYYYIPRHHLVMEKELGRFLTRDEVIIFIDGNKRNFDLSNLMLFNNIGEAIAYKAVLKGGGRTVCECHECGKTFSRFKSNIHSKNVYCSIKCLGKQNEHNKPTANLGFLFKKTYSTSKQTIKIPNSHEICSLCGMCSKHLINKPQGIYCPGCGSITEIIKFKDSPIVIGIKAKKHFVNCVGSNHE